MHSSATTIMDPPPQEKKALQVFVPAGPTTPQPRNDDINNSNPKCLLKPPKKKRGAMYFIKVALFMIKSGSDKSKTLSSSASNSKAMLGQLVGSVRPLHLQADPPEPNRPALTYNNSPAHTEVSEDSMFSSPMAGSSRSTSDTPYSSAVGLNEMVPPDEEEEWDGDKMIDAKAEEFIANFYNQIRLQRRYSINERSLR